MSGTILTLANTEGENEVADGNEKGGPDSEDEGVVHDTVTDYLGDYVPTFADSLYIIPAYHVYGDWDTESIHPYKFDLTKKKDTTVIRLEDYYTCSYEHPILGEITSDFGPRRSRYHYGIDVKLATGDPVKCAFSGKVRIAKYSRSYGNTVVVRHHNGLETLYAHLSEINVKPGDEVLIGDTLGLGGSTGRSTGPHLHFEVRYKGEPINPGVLIDFECGKLKSDELPISAELFAYLKEIRMAKYHTVRSGDTLGHIARRYGTSVSRLCKLNRMRSTSILRIGQRIRYN